MTLTTLRLSYRLGRFELLAFAIAIVAVAIGCVVVAAYLAGLAPPAVCFEPFLNEPPLVCQNSGSAFYEAFSTFGDPLRAAIVSLPLAAGAFLGVPVVARELERGTSRLAWSLAPSRWRWYLARVLPIVVVVTALGLIAGFGADLLLGAAEPNLDVNAAFSLFGYRGIPLAARAVFVLGLAVACGAILGRSLPALIVTAVIAAFALSGGAQVHDRILASEAVPVLQSDFRAGDRWIDTRFQLSDGSLVGYDYFVDGNPYDEMGMPLYPELVLAVPGERYPAAVVREALALAGGSIVALLMGGFVVTRRRPG